MLRTTIACGLFALGLTCAVGCGESGPKLTTVEGTVTHKTAPLADATVAFVPQDGAEGVGGTGITDAQGKYAITYNQGGAGLPIGDYRVIISKRVMPDGSPAPADVEPMDSPAKESLPNKYSHERASELKATVTAEPKPINFDLD